MAIVKKTRDTCWSGCGGQRDICRLLVKLQTGMANWRMEIHQKKKGNLNLKERLQCMFTSVSFVWPSWENWWMHKWGNVSTMEYWPALERGKSCHYGNMLGHCAKWNSSIKTNAEQTPIGCMRVKLMGQRVQQCLSGARGNSANEEGLVDGDKVLVMWVEYTVETESTTKWLQLLYYILEICYEVDF